MTSVLPLGSTYNLAEDFNFWIRNAAWTICLMVIFLPSGRTAYRGISAGGKARLKLSIKEELIKE